MKTKNKILLNILLTLIILIFLNIKLVIKAINSNVNNIKEEEYQSNKIISKLKQIYPKLTNDNLLKKVLTKILEEFDKPYYIHETKTTIEDRIKLLEKYNIIDEFENTIAQTVFDTNEYCFVFPGNKIDFDNYRTYLNYKKQNFQGNKGYSWKIWSPANLEFVSKKEIQFLIDTFEEIIILETEKQANLNKQKNIKQIEEQISSLKQKINTYIDLLKKQKIDILNKNKEIEILKKNIEEQNGQFLALEQQEELIQTQEQKINFLILELKTSNQKINEDKILQEAEKLEFQKDLKNKIEQLNVLKNKLESSQRNIDRLAETQEEQQKIIKNKNEKIKTLEIVVENNNKQIFDLKEEIKKITENLENKIKKNKLLSENQQKISNIEISSLKKDISELRDKLILKEFVLESNKEQITNLFQQLEEKNNEISEMQNLNSLEKQKLQDDIEDNKKQLKKIKNNLDIAQSTITELRQTIKEQKNIIEQKQNKIENLEQNIKIKENIINSLNDQIIKVEQEIKNKKEQIEENKLLSTQEKQKLQNQINEKEKLILDLKSQLYSKENFLIQAQEEINILRNQLQEQKDEIIFIKNLNEEEKNELKNDIKKQTKYLDILENDLDIAYKNIDKLKQTVEEQTDIINNKQKQIFILEKDIEQKESSIENLSKKIENLEQDINSKTKELIENKFLSQETQRLLSEDINQMRKQIKNLKEQMSQKEEFIESSNKKINNLQTNLEIQEEQIKQNQILNQNEKNKLQKDIKKQINSLENLKTKLDKYREKIEISLQNNNMFNYLLIEAMSHMKTMNREVLDFFQKMRQEQEIKKKDESENAKIFFQKTDKFPTFKDVIGNKEATKQLKESLIQFTDDIKEYKIMGNSQPPKGILLYGPPGTGKTYLAKAFAKESGLPFFSITSSDFSKTYVGESPRLVKNIFDEARKHSPSIILIDECETAFKKRNGDGLNSDHGNVVISFLSQIDGIYTDETKPVFVIATTNFKDDIDNSILSRFNKLIKIDFWNEENINIFLKQISKKYNLDIRTYQYLDKISKQIIDSRLDELRTPRKMIELFEQSINVAFYEHKHLNILPIDLQLVIDRLINKQNVINWQEHDHIKPSPEQLYTIQEYKNTPIQHLFVDSDFTDEEKKYFQLIKNNYILNKKLVYNQNSQEKTVEFEVDSNNLERIKKFYSSDNPFPEELLGFYFKEGTESKEIKEIKKTSNLESILNVAIEAKVTQIYFIWNIEKIKHNKMKIEGLMQKYTNEFNFLKSDENLKNKLLEISQVTKNNELEFEKIILKYIEEIKEQLTNNIYDEIIRQNELIILEDSFELKRDITKQINKIFQKNNFLFLKEIKNEIFSNIKNKLIKNKENNLQEKIANLINSITFNTKIFNYLEIDKIKKQINQNVYDYFVIQSKYSLKDIQNQIYKTEKQVNKKLFDKYWKTILKQLNINCNLEKDKIINLLEEKTKKELFYNDLELEKIINLLNEEIEKNIKNLENNLKKKISDNINKYILIDNVLNQKISNQEIDLIKETAFVIAKDELKQENIKEEQMGDQEA
jgi:ATP-dependent 26S proteasome regulatory subunit